ncbi:MAG: hypothetical protein PHR35_06145, partial [Kiritimatiellae bacterium]|nr:hypothetical protein [Kiritimatiellia bacterium]
FGPDYRIGPRETIIETFSWPLPADIALGPVTVTATLNYQLLVEPVARYLNVPSEEYRTTIINAATTTFAVYD